MKPSEQIAMDLEAAKQKARELRMAITKSEASLLANKAALERLEGAWSKWGDIRRLEQRLAEAKLSEADALLPRVRVKGSAGAYREYVLDKVTPKTIRLREPGLSRSEIFNHDGVSTYGKIHPEDLARILADRSGK